MTRLQRMKLMRTAKTVRDLRANMYRVVHLVSVFKTSSIAEGDLCIVRPPQPVQMTGREFFPAKRNAKKRN